MSATQARATRRVSQPGSVVGPESDARHRRDHEVESVGGIASVSGGVTERSSQVEVLEDRHRPAMGADERQRVGLGGTHVDEVDLLPVDRRRELGIGVQPGLVRAPVEACAPVVDELANIVERNPVAPVDALELVGPTCTDEAVVQVVEDVLRNVDTDRIHGCVGHAGDDIDQCGLFQSSLSARLRACSRPRPACSSCSRCCSRAGRGPALSSPSGSGSAGGPCVGTSTGCGAWATPVHAAPGAAGGYQLGAGAELPPLLLDDDEP